MEREVFFTLYFLFFVAGAADAGVAEGKVAVGW
jgi:hypothetical protein